MLETLTAGFQRARERLAGVTTLSDANLDEALGDVRRSLLEADVDYGVVKDFLERVRSRSVGTRVETKVRDIPGVSEVHVDLVWDPPWSPDKMSEAAKLRLNMM